MFAPKIRPQFLTVFGLLRRARIRTMHVTSINRRTDVTSTLFSILGSTYLIVSSTMTQAGCSPALTEQIVSAERIVDSLRPDKAGQMRVFATDGSQYSAGEAVWMKGQLRSVLRSCNQGDENTASSTLRGVTDLLKAHHSSL
jgi:hypothetical protein